MGGKISPARAKNGVFSLLKLQLFEVWEMMAQQIICKREKNTNCFFGFGFLFFVQKIHFAKKLSQNGQFCPQQGQKQFTPDYMGSPLLTQMIHIERDPFMNNKDHRVG